MKNCWMTFKLAPVYYLSIVLIAFYVASTSCEDPDELRPINHFLNEKDEYLIRTKLICRGWQCPNFTVVRDVTPYLQERHYDTQDIISTTTSHGCENLTTAVMEGYIQLFKYRKGSNEKNKQVEMTVPLVVQVTHLDRKTCSTKYKMWIYANLDNNTSENALPEPTEEGVTLEKLRPLEVFVRTYTGPYNETQSPLEKLDDDLDDADLCYAKKSYIIAMYDPPWKKGGRRNEIWLEKQPCQ